MQFTSTVRRLPVSVSILDDTVVEGDEFFEVKLSGDRVSSVLSVARVTIEDDDAVVIGFSPTVSSVDEDAGSVELTVLVLSGTIVDVESVTVVVRTIDGSAVSGEDYTELMETLTLTFAADTLMVPVTVMIEDDMLLELDQHFFVELSGNRVSDSASVARVTILDNDVDAGELPDGDDPSSGPGDGEVLFEELGYDVLEGAGSVTLVAILSGAISSSESVSVSVTTIDGSATVAGDDYTETTLTLQFTSTVRRLPVTVDILDDTVVEGDEFFEVKLSGDRVSSVLSVARVTIEDDDAVVIGFSPTVSSVDEDAGSVELTVLVLSGTIVDVESVTVVVRTIDGSAVSGEDYTELMETLTLTFAADTLMVPVTVMIEDDMLLELDQHFFVELSGNRVSDSASVARVTILDNDVDAGELPDGDDPSSGPGDGEVLFEELGYDVLEGAGSVTLVAILSGAISSSESVSVSVTTIDGSATVAGDDYTETTLTLQFTSTVRRLPVTVDILDDTVVEGDEFFEVKLSGDRVSSGSSVARVTITDDDAVGVEIGFSPVEYSVSEGAGSVELTVSVLSGDIEDGVNVEVAVMTTERSAVAGADYSEFTDTLTFTSEVTTQTVSVSILPDDDVESDEVFSVNLLGADVLDTASTALVTILRNDFLELSFDRSLYMADEGDTVTLAVSLINLSDTVEFPPSGVWIILGTEEGLAKSSDYGSLSPSELFFSEPSTSTRAVTINIVDDEFGERASRFRVVASDGMGLFSSAEIEISESDGGSEFAVSIMPSPVSATSNQRDNNRDRFNRFRAFDENGEDYVPYFVLERPFRTGEEGSDTFFTSIGGDGYVNPDEEILFDLQISSVFSEEVVVSWEVECIRATDADFGRREDVPGTGGTRIVALSEGDNVCGRTGSTSIPGGSEIASEFLSVIALPDNIAEFDQLFRVRITDVNSALVKIDEVLDDVTTIIVDNVQGVSFTIGSIVGTNNFISRDEGSDLTVFGAGDIFVAPALQEDAVLYWRIVCLGFGAEDADFSINPGVKCESAGSVTLPRGSRTPVLSGDVLLASLLDDELADNGERFRIEFTGLHLRPSDLRFLQGDDRSGNRDAFLNNYNGILYRTIEIRDRDTEVRVSGPAEVTEAPGISSTFRFELYEGARPESRPVSRNTDIVVDFALLCDGSSSASSEDFTDLSCGSTGTVTIPSGSMFAELEVNISDDNVAELDETFRVVATSVNPESLSGLSPEVAHVAVAPGALSSALVTIRDNDAIGVEIGFSPTAYRVDEDAGNVELTVSVLSEIIIEDGVNVEVTVMTGDGSANSGEDYTSTTATLTFTSSMTEATVTVFITDDVIAEGEENFIVSLSSNRVSSGSSVATVTIRDDDAVDVEIGFSPTDYDVSEGAGIVELTVSVLSGDIESGVSLAVVVMTVDGSAFAGEDYSELTETLVFTSIMTEATVNVMIVNDGLAEGEETFEVELSSERVSSGSSVATVTISDDDAIGVEIGFSPTDYEVSEGAGIVELTVSVLSGDIEAGVNVEVTVMTIDGSAVAGEDYTSTTATLTFTSSVTEATVSVFITDDAIVEDEETFEVELSGERVSSGSDVAMVTITDDDVEIGFSPVTLYMVDEDAGSITLTVSVLGGTIEVGESVTLSVRTIDGSAVAGEDYTELTETLVFTSIMTETTVTVDILDDVLVEGEETFEVELSGERVSSGSGVATVTITDDDAVGVEIGFEPTDYRVDEDAGSVELTVSVLSGDIEAGVSVAVTVMTGDGSALSGEDYAELTQTLVFTSYRDGSCLCRWIYWTILLRKVKKTL